MNEMMFANYILDENKQVQAVGFLESVTYRRNNPEATRVARDVVNNRVVSTIFLWVDAARSLHEPPVYFETKTFHLRGDGKIGRQAKGELLEDRYSTYEEAEQGHKEIVGRVKGES